MHDSLPHGEAVWFFCRMPLDQRPLAFTGSFCTLLWRIE
jgi:hypothetical protein